MESGLKSHVGTQVLSRRALTFEEEKSDRTGVWPHTMGLARSRGPKGCQKDRPKSSDLWSRQSLGFERERERVVGDWCVWAVPFLRICTRGVLSAFHSGTSAVHFEERG